MWTLEHKHASRRNGRGFPIIYRQLKILKFSGSAQRHDWHGDWNYTLTPT